MRSGLVTSRHRRAGAAPRTVLLWAVIMVAAATGLYFVAPWILPPRIREGPLVQMATTDGVTLVWYTTRPAACRVAVTIGPQSREFEATAAGTRHRVRISGLAPDSSYPYEIRSGGRRLVGGLAFQTNRAAGERFTFLVFGDSGTGGRSQYLLGGLMARTMPPADFLLHTGDLVYPDGARRRYEERFFAPYRDELARVSFWPCLGNHDVGAQGRAPAYEEVFDLPANGPPTLPVGHCYWFDYSTARIAVIDSNLDEPTLQDKVAPWLQEVLATREPRWKFVAFHHPPYTGGQYAPDVRIQRTLVPVIEAAGVDVVFLGHDHTYQRTFPLLRGQVVSDDTGVVYVITAAGGGHLYEPRQPRPEYIAVFDNQHFSFTQVAVDGDELTLHQIALEGNTLDEWTRRKTSIVAEPDVAPADLEKEAPAEP